jgi:hypothetical protein
MTTQPNWNPTSTNRIHPTQVRLAFLEDAEHARPARLTGVDGDAVSVHYLDDTTGSVTVADPERLADVLDRDDLCRLDGQPLLLVNTAYRVLAVATGPAAPPSRLAVLIVCRLEDGSVVELLSEADDQPAWQTFALQADRPDPNG